MVFEGWRDDALHLAYNDKICTPSVFLGINPDYVAIVLSLTHIGITPSNPPVVVVTRESPVNL